MISPETIALVRDRTDILAVIGEGVPSLKRRGRSWVGLCPFHKEKSPSFHVNPDRGFFHCFGCKESGSAIDFLMKHEGYTFPEAVRALAERAGIPIEETKNAAHVTEADRQRKAKDDLYAVNALAATYFEDQLRKHEHRAFALEELEKRGLTPTWAGGKDAKIDEVLQAFRIGYAPSGWDGLASFLKAQGVSPVAAETVGLLVPRSSGSGYYDRFRHRLMFAVVDPQGRVVAFSGRALRDLPEAEPGGGPRPGLVRLDDPDARKPPKYINSPESPVYTKGQMLFGIHQARHEIRRSEIAVLVEGNFDVVSLHARGIGNVVAPLGTAFTTEQAKLLRRFAPNVVFLFDGDAAGRKAVRLSRDSVKAAGISARVAELPNGVDPDELSRAKGPKAIEDLIASAKGMLEALVEMTLDESFTQADAYEKQARIAFVAKLLADEDDPIVHAMAKGFTDMIAGRLDIVRSGEGAFRALESSVKQALARAEAERRRVDATRAPQPSGDGTRITPRPPGQAERKEIVSALVDWPGLVSDSEVAEELALLEGESVKVVAALRRTWNPATRTLDTDAFLGHLEERTRAFVARRLAAPETESQEAAKEYLLRNAEKLKRLLLSQETAQFARETYRAHGDTEHETELLREASERARAKHGLKG
ncbi:MAG: toprim domain-containing protein [Deltaproteobacteria bacterium]|nr:toprim domain-containing protein [Deltaproteobacteria bacterium]